MSITNIKGLIENKLACIDIENKHSKGETRATKWDHELCGIRQALEFMGFELELSKNPYYWENGEPSTYKLSFSE